MLWKNCHQVLRSQKSKLTPLELVFRTAGAINPPPPSKDRVKTDLLQFFFELYFYQIDFALNASQNNES